MNEDSHPAMTPVPVVIFDFDHTLYDGDCGREWIAWLIRRHPIRLVLALLASPLLGMMIVYLPTRRMGIAGYIWIATVGGSHSVPLQAHLERYLQGHRTHLQAKLLAQGIAVLQAHRRAGHRVIVATGSPTILVQAIVDQVMHLANMIVVGSELGDWAGGRCLARHCHAAEKVRMLNERGIVGWQWAYSDSTADYPLLSAARHPTVVNPKVNQIAFWQQSLPKGTPIENWGCSTRGGRARQA